MSLKFSIVTQNSFGRPVLLLAAALIVASLSPGRSQAQICIGDCNGDCSIAINELILGVRINIGEADRSTCPSFDGNDSGGVEVNELILGVRGSLNGCPDGCVRNDTPSPTLTPDPNTTPSATSTPDPNATDTFTPDPVDSFTPTPTVGGNGTSTPIPPTPPDGLVLAGASATDNGSVRVDFNGVVDGPSGLNPSNYQIVQELTSANGPKILSTRFLNRCIGGDRAGSACNDTSTDGPGCPGGSCSEEDRRVVVLATSTLAEIPYKLTVTGVRDTAGSTIVVRDIGGRGTNESKFAGPPLAPVRHCPATTAMMTLENGFCQPVLCDSNDDCPEGDFCVDRIQDCDGDGLDDDTEARGWTIRIRGEGPEITEERIVTSDPFDTDTDNDGLTDDEERTANDSGSTSHPRRVDTDGDNLDDFQEVALWRIDPSDTVTDDDGLPDGLEVSGRSAPHRQDTDGDGILDAPDTGLRTRQVADMPYYDIVVENATVTLDYEWALIEDQSTVDMETGTQSLTMSRETSMESRNVSELATEWWAGVSTSAEFTYNSPFDVGVS